MNPSENLKSGAQAALSESQLLRELDRASHSSPDQETFERIAGKLLQKTYGGIYVSQTTGYRHAVALALQFREREETEDRTLTFLSPTSKNQLTVSEIASESPNQEALEQFASRASVLFQRRRELIGATELESWLKDVRHLQQDIASDDEKAHDAGFLKIINAYVQQEVLGHYRDEVPELTSDAAHFAALSSLSISSGDLFKNTVQAFREVQPLFLLYLAKTVQQFAGKGISFEKAGEIKTLLEQEGRKSAESYRDGVVDEIGSILRERIGDKASDIWPAAESAVQSASDLRQLFENLKSFPQKAHILSAVLKTARGLVLLRPVCERFVASYAAAKAAQDRRSNAHVDLSILTEEEATELSTAQQDNILESVAGLFVSHFYKVHAVEQIHNPSRRKFLLTRILSELLANTAPPEPGATEEDYQRCLSELSRLVPLDQAERFAWDLSVPIGRQKLISIVYALQSLEQGDIAKAEWVASKITDGKLRSDIEKRIARARSGKKLSDIPPSSELN